MSDSYKWKHSEDSETLKVKTYDFRVDAFEGGADAITQSKTHNFKEKEKEFSKNINQQKKKASRP